MNHKQTIAGALGAAMATLAMAPGIASAEPFNGPYAGAEAGMGIMKSKGTTLAGPLSKSDDSAMIGGVAGYRMPLGKDEPLVLGAEGGAAIDTQHGDARYMVSGIGGVKFSNQAMVYGRVGYAWNEGLPKGADHGLVLGAGAEVALTDTLGVRAEYRNIDYGKINFPDNVADYKGHEIMAGLMYNF